MIHSSQVRGLHLLLIVVETPWCHISPRLRNAHITALYSFPPEFRLVARSRLFPPTPKRTPLCEQARTQPQHVFLPSRSIHPCTSQKCHSCKISIQSSSPTPISSITSLTLTPRESAIRPMSPWPTSLISLYACRRSMCLFTIASACAWSAGSSG
jgi:hypothetical protein